jgi:SAM-dependent methyltransferase
MEEVACDYCGSHQYVTVAKQTDLIHSTTTEYFQIVQCVACGLNFTNPRPAVGEIDKYYSAHYSFHGVDTKIRAVLRKLSAAFVNSRFGSIFDLLPKIGIRLARHVKPQLVDPVRQYYERGGIGMFLDIGCGSGMAAHYWGEAGSLNAYGQLTDVAGVEVSESARVHLEKRGIQVWESLDAVPQNLRFSVIRMNWSLEHVHSPSEYFSFIAERLERNGIAIIAVPNYDGLIYKIAKDCVELPVHLYHFRPTDIENYATRFELAISSFYTYSYPQMFGFAAQIGMLPKSFEYSNISNTKKFQFVLNKFDAAGLGNDMIFILKSLK